MKIYDQRGTLLLLEKYVYSSRESKNKAKGVIKNIAKSISEHGKKAGKIRDQFFFGSGLKTVD